MKRFTKKASALLIMVLLSSAILVQAEKRYVFALGGFPADGPNWQSSWVDMRLNDVDRTLYIWPAGESIVGVPAQGTGALGQEGYQAFTVGNLGWWGCGYFVGPDAGNPNAEMDMTDVDDTWVLHFSIRTDCAQDITLNLYGCTPDPTDPFVTDRTVGRYQLTKTNLPVAKRDKVTWTDFEIPISQLQPYKDNVLTPSLKLSFAAPVKKQNYFTLSGGNDTGSFIAWDNIYLGKTATGINTPETEKLKIQVTDNELNVLNNRETVEIYSVSGAKLISTSENKINISGLSSGVYIVKAGNLINKFSK